MKLQSKIRKMRNAIEARYELRNQVSTILNVNGLTIRKLSGENLTDVIKNFNKKAHGVYVDLLEKCPENVKNSRMYKNELTKLTPVIEAGTVRLARIGYDIKGWDV